MTKAWVRRPMIFFWQWRSAMCTCGVALVAFCVLAQQAESVGTLTDEPASLLQPPPRRVPSDEKVTNSGDKHDSLRIVVVMEQATARGRVVLLEDADNERSAVNNCRIELWTPDKQNRLHATQTDRFGMFDMPEQQPGIYLLVVGTLQLGLQVLPAVIPEDTNDADVAPKILFILVPKEVV